MRPQEQQNGKPAASGDISGALELVNKAIEEVRSQVEREKRKLSRIGDEPYNPSENASLSSCKTDTSKAAGSHLAYDPGSYQITSGGYNPTPGCSKYTLDSDNQGHNSNSMEYVPTSLKRPLSRTHSHQPPSPPPSPKRSNSTSSSKCKYTVDNSRPSTDMEYDPLSNYSAGIAVKNKRSEGARPVRTEGSKAHKLSGSEFSDEDYVVAAKKPRQQSVDTKKYTFSDSDGESSGAEYRPTSLSNLQQRKAAHGSDSFGKGRKGSGESLLNALMQRNKQDSDTQENIKRKDSPEKKKKEGGQTSQKKSSKTEKLHKLEKGANKSSGSKSSVSSSSKDRGSIKSSNQDSAKKENRSHDKKDDRKNTVKVKTSDKIRKESRDEKKSDTKLKTLDKVKTDSSKQDKHAENGARESKKPKTSDKEKEQSKYKEHPHKNGKLDGIRREKDAKKVSKSGSSSSKASPSNSKDKARQSVGASSVKRQSLSLSHADLFGDESPDEAEQMEADYDDETEEVLVRKSADALKRTRLNKRKASELTPSSSEDEGDRDVDCSRAGRDEVDGVRFDLSGFQDDLDFDSDPMEECLRIFNESKDVKKEDKGRQAKQVLMSVAL